SARRWTAIISLVACVAIAYGAFVLTSNAAAVRQNVGPRYAVDRIGAGIVYMPFKLIRSLTYVLIGSYGNKFSCVQPNWSSKWSIGALLYGVTIGFALSYLVGSKRPQSGAGPGALRLRTKSFVLLVAIMAGAAPVILMGRDNAQTGFGSRFLLPILPVAVMAT